MTVMNEVPIPERQIQTTIPLGPEHSDPVTGKPLRSSPLCGPEVAAPPPCKLKAVEQLDVYKRHARHRALTLIKDLTKPNTDGVVPPGVLTDGILIGGLTLEELEAAARACDGTDRGLTIEEIEEAHIDAN